MNLKGVIKSCLMRLSALVHRNKGSKIFYYHDIFISKNYKALDADAFMGTPLSLFKEHVKIIRDAGFEIVQNITKPEGQVAIMLDDGFRGIWECREFFYEEKIFPTIFLPVDYVDKVNEGMLSVEEILELQTHGFKFESHGWSHRPLTAVSKNELTKELKDSREFLSNLLGKDVKEICMPLGYFNNDVLEEIRNAGYDRTYSCIPGNCNEAPYGLVSRNLCQFASPMEVKLILKGGNELLKSRYIKLHKRS